jgi:methylenetetrahydrofolate--tRNA-(uracil-5-)-methyltransferase
MRPSAPDAHKTATLAELVCSNRSARRRDQQRGPCTRRCALGSLIMAAADAHKLPAGGALAVD